VGVSPVGIGSLRNVVNINSRYRILHGKNSGAKVDRFREYLRKRFCCAAMGRRIGSDVMRKEYSPRPALHGLMEKAQTFTGRTHTLRAYSQLCSLCSVATTHEHRPPPSIQSLWGTPSMSLHANRSQCVADGQH